VVEAFLTRVTRKSLCSPPPKRLCDLRHPFFGIYSARTKLVILVVRRGLPHSPLSRASTKFKFAPSFFSRGSRVSHLPFSAVMFFRISLRLAAFFLRFSPLLADSGPLPRYPLNGVLENLPLKTAPFFFSFLSFALLCHYLSPFFVRVVTLLDRMTRLPIQFGSASSRAGFSSPPF